MSTEITRMYANAATAAKAASELREEGYGDVFVVGPPAADTPLSAIAAQIAQGRVLLADAKIYAKGVAAGHALVTVHAPFGSGAVATSSVSAKSSDAVSAGGMGVPPAARSATNTLGGGAHAPEVIKASGVRRNSPSVRKKHMLSHAVP